MRWPFRYKRHPSDVRGIEQAKEALAMAKQIEVHATISAAQHSELQRRNGFGPKIHKALGGR